MKKNSLSGWKDVFTFTLIQTLKSKSFLVSFLIMLIISVGAMPVLSIVLKDKDEQASKSLIETVYVKDETHLSDTGFLPVLEDEYYRHITFLPLTEDYDQLLERIDNKETTSVVLDVTNANGYFSLHFTKSSNGEVTKSDTQTLGALVEEKFREYLLEATGVTQEQLDFIHLQTSTMVTAADVNGNEILEEDTTITEAQYWFIYGIFFVVMMVTNLASTQIASSIASDKSTRVVEYLLTSVKPLALMLGKIMAMLVAVVGQTLVLILAILVSNKVTTSMFMNGEVSLIEKYLPAELLSSLNILNIIICLLVIALGLMFCGTLAGLAGATVSKIEELNEGMTLFMVVNMVGAYIGIIAAGTLMGAGMNGFVTFALLLPISSPYLLPGAILVGKVSLPMAAGAIALQILCIILLLRFVAKIYETLILHNGNTVSPKALIKMAKLAKKEGIANE